MLKSLERCGITNSLEPTTPVANRTAAQDGVAVQLDRNCVDSIGNAGANLYISIKYLPYHKIDRELGFFS